MSKTNQIKKVVNGEIADADDINQIVENAGSEGGSIPYDPTSDQRSTDGTQSLGSTSYPWGSLKINQDAEFVEVNPSSHTAANSVKFSNLRKFNYLKDVPSSYSGKGGQKVSVKSDETGLEFTNPNGIPGNIQVFTSSGTWTRPSGIDQVYVKAWGAGGGGGARQGGGGGGGGYAEGLIDVTGNVTVTIGAAGTGGSSGAGTAGGNTTFAGSTTLTANGGGAGLESAGGAGGSASNGDINLTGQTGETGASNLGGYGGASFGGSTTPRSLLNTTNGVGINAYSVGSGGSGGGTSGNAGGNGSNGMVIVYY